MQSTIARRQKCSKLAMRQILISGGYSLKFALQSMVFAPFWSEKGLDFAYFWSEFGFSFRGNA